MSELTITEYFFYLDEMIKAIPKEKKATNGT